MQQCIVKNEPDDFLLYLYIYLSGLQHFCTATHY